MALKSPLSCLGLLQTKASSFAYAKSPETGNSILQILIPPKADFSLGAVHFHQAIHLWRKLRKHRCYCRSLQLCPQHCLQHKATIMMTTQSEGASVKGSRTQALHTNPIHNLLRWGWHPILHMLPRILKPTAHRLKATPHRLKATPLRRHCSIAIPTQRHKFTRLSTGTDAPKPSSTIRHNTGPLLAGTRVTEVDLGCPGLVACPNRRKSVKQYQTDA